MNYYLVIIQNNDTCAVFKYTDYDECLSKMHTELAYRGTSKDPRNETLCVIIKGDSTIPNLEYWKKQEEEGVEE